MTNSRLALWIALGFGAAALPLRADPDIHDTRLLSEPAVSARQIALHLRRGPLGLRPGRRERQAADLDGPAPKSHPAFSPDGNWRGLLGELRGATPTCTPSPRKGSTAAPDVAPGGRRRQGFTADGKSVPLHLPPASSPSAGYTQLFTVPVEGGLGGALPTPHARPRGLLRRTASASPTTRSARRSSVEALPRRRGRRASGSTTSRNARGRGSPQPCDARQRRRSRSGCGGTVYFRSDRDGEFNRLRLRHEVESRQAA